MGQLHTGPKHPLSGTDPESYFNLHIVPPGYQPKREGDYEYQALYNQAYSRWVGLVSISRLPTQERGIPIINTRTGEARQSWFATPLC